MDNKSATNLQPATWVYYFDCHIVYLLVVNTFFSLSLVVDCCIKVWITIMHDFSISSQRVVRRVSKAKRITWAKVYRWKQFDYAIAASMTPPFILFSLYAFGRSRATLLTMTPHREQHQTCSSRSSIKNKTISTQRTWEVVNPGSN